MDNRPSTSLTAADIEEDASGRRSSSRHNLERFRHASDTSESHSQNLQRSQSEDVQHTLTRDKETTSGSGKNTGKSSKSEVWQHYTKITSTSARCEICLKSIKHGGNTTNMMQHLKHSHSMHVPSKRKQPNNTAAQLGNFAKRATNSEEYNSAEDVDDPPQKRSCPSETLSETETAKSQRIDKAFNRIKSLQGRGPSATKITNSILYMISVDNLPLSIVENKGFKRLMRTTVPLYTVPSRKTITKELELRYHAMKNTFRDNLAAGTTHTLTCDIWTDVANQSYLSVTDHYLTPDLEMKNGCLGVIPLSERHTADYISRNIRETLESFGIETTDVTAIVSDCGANIKKAATDTFGPSKHIPCFAHVLSHIVPSVLKTLPEVENIFTRVQSIVTITKRSVVAADELKRLQISSGKTEGTALKLKQDVPTRWNSSFYMIERFLELREYIYPVLIKCPTAPEMLTREETQILEDCVLLLRPIENVITEISGDTYPTGNMAIPIIRCMEKALSYCTPVTTIGKDLKSKLIAKVEDKFSGIETCELLAIATILDPRFKKVHFRSALTASVAIAAINKAMKSASSDQPTSVAPTRRPPESSTSRSIWDFHDDMIASNTPSGSDSSEIHLELRQYLHQPLQPRHSSPIEYWRGVKNAFPTLYAIAVKYLNLIATSVPSERLFSKAGAVKTDRRNRLSGKRLNMLLFLGSLSERDWGF